MSSQMQLSSLRIDNFQYWERFDKTLIGSDGQPFETLVIFGKSGSGKSTLLKAIRWLAYGKQGNEKKSNAFPLHWKDKHVDDVVVRASFIKTVGRKDQTIILERRHEPGKDRTTIKVTIDEQEFKGSEASQVWNNQVGKPPGVREGAMWMIRPREIERILKSIGGREGQDYLLQFHNQEEMIAKMEEECLRLREAWEAAQRASTTQGQDLKKYQQARDDYDTLREQQKERQKQIAAMGTEIEQMELDGDRENELELGLERERLETEEGVANIQHRDSQLGKDGFDMVSRTCLVSFMKNAGLGDLIPKETIADKYEWEEMLSEIEDRISGDSKAVITQIIDSKTGMDLSQLRIGGVQIQDAVDALQSLKDTRKELFRIQDRLDDLEQYKITKEVIHALSIRKDGWKLRIEEREKLQGIERESIEEIGAAKELRDDLMDSANSSIQKAKDAKRIGTQYSISRKIVDALSSAEEEYRSKMFNSAIAQMKEFFEDTSTSDIFTPVYDQSRQLLVLEDRAGNIYEIDPENDDLGGGPATGQSWQSLACLGMALAKQSACKLPVFLDDIVTASDDDTRPEIFRLAARKFDHCIFNLNSSDTMSKIEDSISSVLYLERGEIDGRAAGNLDVSPDLAKLMLPEDAVKRARKATTSKRGE